MDIKHLVLLSFLPFSTSAWADAVEAGADTMADEARLVDAVEVEMTSMGASTDNEVNKFVADPSNLITNDDDSVYARSLNRRHIERINRDDLKATFVPKGQWMVGGTINFQQWDTENIDILVLKNMQYNAYSFSGSPYFGYFIKDNLAVGARYSYSRNNAQLDQFDLNLGDDFNISLADLSYIGHHHQASAFLRNYMPIGKSKIFGFFTEIDAAYAMHQSKNSTGRIEDKTFDGTYLTTHSVQLGFMPGLTAFVTDFAAVECSIGVLGLSYKWGEATANRVETSKISSGGANFKFNLLNVNLGMTFYL